MKVKYMKSVHTYSRGPSLGYEAYSLIMIPAWCLILRLGDVRALVLDGPAGRRPVFGCASMSVLGTTIL